MNKRPENTISSGFMQLADTTSDGYLWSAVQKLADLGKEIQQGESRFDTSLPQARRLWKEMDGRIAMATTPDPSASALVEDTMSTEHTLRNPSDARLYTSIPPFAPEFARCFCAAWNSIGFEICTVNSASECEIIRSWGIQSLQIIEARRDASQQYGRPLIYIQDLLEIIRENSNGMSIVGIVNADIMPSPLQDWKGLLGLISSISFHCFKRAEVQVLANGNYHVDPSTYEHGYDLFMWKSSNGMPYRGHELGFAFGVPWWDYWFPMERLLAGDDVVSHECCWIFHKSHDVNFDVSLFADKGNDFLRYMQSRKAPRMGDYASERIYSTDELCSFCTHCIEEIDAAFFRKAHESTQQEAEGVSLVTACMNRNENLLKAIHSWLPFEQIKEIIVVDWSSSTKVEESLSGIHDPRVRVIRIDGKRDWVLSHAFNAGLREARFALTLKLDADVVLKEGFFDLHIPSEDLFFAGNWRNAKNDSEKRLNGSFFASTRLVKATGLYNEHITTYGWDDCDLYSRFGKLARRDDFDMACLSHCEQEASSRISNQVSKLALHPLEIAPDVETELEIRVNEYLAFFSPDWHSCASLGHDRGNARAMSYRFALINELSRDYQSGGSGLSHELLSQLSLDGLLIFFACRHNQQFWRSSILAEFYQKIACVPWNPQDAKIISCGLREILAEHEDIMPYSPLAVSTSCERMLFHSKVKFSVNDKDPCYAGLLSQVDTLPPLVPYFFEQITIKAMGKRVTSVSTVFNSDLHIEQFIEDIAKQTAFAQALFIFIICNSRQREFKPLHNFCMRYPSNTVIINLPHDPGLYESWNMAISATTTDYITNWNTDDRRAPDHLEKMIGILDEKQDVDLVSAALYVSYEPNTSFKQAADAGMKKWFEGPDRLFTDRDMFQLNKWEEPELAKRVVISQNYAHCMPVWRKSLHERFGLFNECDYGPSADWELWLRAGRGGSRFLLHGEVLGVYYLNAQSYGRRDAAIACDARITREYLTAEQEQYLREND